MTWPAIAINALQEIKAEVGTSTRAWRLAHDALAAMAKAPLFEPGSVQLAELGPLVMSPDRVVAVEVMAQLTRFVVRKQMTGAEAAALAHELTREFLKAERGYAPEAL